MEHWWPGFNLRCLSFSECCRHPDTHNPRSAESGRQVGLHRLGASGRQVCLPKFWQDCKEYLVRCPKVMEEAIARMSEMSGHGLHGVLKAHLSGLPQLSSDEDSVSFTMPGLSCRDRWAIGCTNTTEMSVTVKRSPSDSSSTFTTIRCPVCQQRCVEL